MMWAGHAINFGPKCSQDLLMPLCVSSIHIDEWRFKISQIVFELGNVLEVTEINTI